MTEKNTYLCWEPDEGEDESCAMKVAETDAEEAAKTYAEKRDEGENPTEERTVWVRAPDGILSKWEITAEATVDYHAFPLDDEDEDET